MRDRYNRYVSRKEKKPDGYSEYGKPPSDDLLAKLPVIAEANIPGQ